MNPAARRRDRLGHRSRRLTCGGSVAEPLGRRDSACGGPAGSSSAGRRGWLGRSVTDVWASGWASWSVREPGPASGWISWLGADEWLSRLAGGEAGRVAGPVGLAGKPGGWLGRLAGGKAGRVAGPVGRGESRAGGWAGWPGGEAGRVAGPVGRRGSRAGGWASWPERKPGEWLSQLASRPKPERRPGRPLSGRPPVRPGSCVASRRAGPRSARRPRRGAGCLPGR